MFRSYVWGANYHIIESRLVGDDNPSAEDIEESELEEKALNAMDDVETFSMTYNQSVEMMGTTTQTTVDGVMDLEAQQAEMTTTVDGMGMEEEMQQYIIGDTLYQEVLGEWVQMELPGESVWENHETAQQEEALELGELDITDTTTFDGHEVYVVDIEIDEDDFEEVMEDPDAGMDGGFEDEFGEDELMDGVEFTDAHITHYIDAETYHVRYVEMEFDMETQMGAFTTEAQMTFGDFDEEVDIELPPEAEDAPDFDDWMGDGFEDMADA